MRFEQGDIGSFSWTLMGIAGRGGEGLQSGSLDRDSGPNEKVKKEKGGISLLQGQRERHGVLAQVSRWRV